MRAAIILAAGASRRFGRPDKLKMQVRGQSLLAHAVANARASGALRILLVASRPTSFRNVTPVRARDASKGLSASLAAGLAALRPVEREVLIFLADMPFARAPRMELKAGVAAIRPCFHDRPGHPMLVRAAAARKALAGGDAGLAGKLEIACVRGDAGNIIDIDTPSALRQVRRYGSCALGRRSSLA